MYLDNTFSTPNEDFPSQEVAYKFLKEKVREFRNENQDYKFFLYCYTLGKEEVFVNLARDFQTRLKIQKDRWNRLDVIGLAKEDQFTLHELEAQINKINKAKKTAATTNAS